MYAIPACILCVCLSVWRYFYIDDTPYVHAWRRTSRRDAAPNLWNNSLFWTCCFMLLTCLINMRWKLNFCTCTPSQENLYFCLLLNRSLHTNDCLLLRTLAAVLLCFKCYNSYWLNHDNNSADFVTVFVRFYKNHHNCFKSLSQDLLNSTFSNKLRPITL